MKARREMLSRPFSLIHFRLFFHRAIKVRGELRLGHIPGKRLCPTKLHGSWRTCTCLRPAELTGHVQVCVLWYHIPTTALTSLAVSLLGQHRARGPQQPL